jgi:hypothetical protein
MANQPVYARGGQKARLFTRVNIFIPAATGQINVNPTLEPEGKFLSCLWLRSLWLHRRRWCLGWSGINSDHRVVKAIGN